MGDTENRDLTGRAERNETEHRLHGERKGRGVPELRRVRTRIGTRCRTFFSRVTANAPVDGEAQRLQKARFAKVIAGEVLSVADSGADQLGAKVPSAPWHLAPVLFIAGHNSSAPDPPDVPSKAAIHGGATEAGDVEDCSDVEHKRTAYSDGGTG